MSELGLFYMLMNLNSSISIDWQRDGLLGGSKTSKIDENFWENPSWFFVGSCNENLIEWTRDGGNPKCIITLTNHETNKTVNCTMSYKRVKNSLRKKGKQNGCDCNCTALVIIVCFLVVLAGGWHMFSADIGNNTNYKYKSQRQYAYSTPESEGPKPLTTREKIKIYCDRVKFLPNGEPCFETYKLLESSLALESEWDSDSLRKARNKWFYTNHPDKKKSDKDDDLFVVVTAAYDEFDGIYKNKKI